MILLIVVMAFGLTAYGILVFSPHSNESPLIYAKLAATIFVVLLGVAIGETARQQRALAKCEATQAEPTP